VGCQGRTSRNVSCPDEFESCVLINHLIPPSLPAHFVRIYRKDVRLPVLLQRAMAAEAEATREARAKVIAAEGEQRASRALKEAAEVISG
jgi:regulator of protease activity HflC (stomatin/prohibitin superfamily)